MTPEHLHLPRRQFRLRFSGKSIGRHACKRRLSCPAIR
jgi:hypothetical protein